MTITRLFFVSTLLLLSSWSLQAQSYRIQGVVKDSLQEVLTGATVVALDPADSTMLSFAITDGQGRFALTRLEGPSCDLQITYIGYGTFQQPVTFTPGEGVVDLGEIWLSPENQTLQTVLVKSEHIPVLIKGDTIQYQADAFATRPDDNVENLLKKLPGVEVERDGSIKAQGEDVNNVLVDGKPFFGNNPQIATRNLPADAVDNVQVYDETSDLEEFSGIDDGQEEKTINLVLKDDKKNGYFGELSGGYGTDGRYEGRANVNRFNNTTQMSLLGMANNTNEPGFSIGEFIDFLGGFERLMGQGGGMLQLNSDDVGIPLNFGNNPGVATSKAMGLNFNHDFSKETQLTSNYFLNQLDRRLDQNFTRRNFLEDAAFNSAGSLSEQSRTLGHRLNLELKHEMGERQRLSWRSSAGLTDGRTTRNQDIQNFDTSDMLENESNQTYRLLPQRWLVNSQLDYFLKFQKAGRLLTASLAYDRRWNDNQQNIYNRNAFILPDQALLLDSIDQQQTTTTSESTWRTSLSFTEPIGERLYWQNRAVWQLNQDERDKVFLDRSESEDYERNEDLSNAFERGYEVQRIGSGLLWTGQKSRLDFMLQGERSVLRPIVVGQNTLPERTFQFLLPRASWQYDITDSRNFELSYQSSTTAPSLLQLQPVLDNTNALNIYQGNPELRPEYRHQLSGSLAIIDNFSFTNFFLNLSTSYIEDRIINQQFIDSLLRQVRTPVNADFEWQNRLFASFSTPIRPLKVNVSLHGSATYGKGILDLNGIEDRVDRWNHEWSLSLDNRKKELIDWEVGATLNYSIAAYEQLSNFDQNYLRRDLFGLVTVFLPQDWVISTEVEYQHFSDESFGNSDGYTLWRASLRKSLLKNNRLVIRLSVFDILNQNTGIDRQNAFNYFGETRSNALGRYAMLSATYKLAAFEED